MFGKILTVTLAILLFNLASASPARAADTQEPSARGAEKAKEEIGRLGTGAQARVKVRLKDGAKVEGYVGEADDEGFMLVDAKGGRTRVTYAQVESVKRVTKSHWKTFDPKEFALGAALIGGIFLVAIWGVSQTK
jgi:hypothetical protein